MKTYEGKWKGIKSTVKRKRVFALLPCGATGRRDARYDFTHQDLRGVYLDGSGSLGMLLTNPETVSDLRASFWFLFPRPPKNNPRGIFLLSVGRYFCACSFVSLDARSIVE